MTRRIQLLCACLAFLIACTAIAPVVAQQQEGVVQSVESSVLDSVIDAPQEMQIDIVSQDVLVEAIEIAPTEYPFVDAVEIFEVDPNVTQCVTVKKSPLGCLEGIEILPQDEVWLINARACLCGESDPALLCVSRLVGNHFLPTDLSVLTAAHASGDELATVLYVHGNQTNQEYAIARGLQVYRNAFAKTAHCHGGVRYVIWAWKSEQEKRRLYPDYLIKSNRSVLLGETFAATLNQFGDRNLVVFGYSLGVQVALSAFDSRSLLPRYGDPTRYKVAFAAPAINAAYVASHALAIGGDSPIAQTYVFTNRKDRAIRAAQSIIRRKSPADEATIEGLSNAGKLNLGPITSLDVFEEAGPFHSIERYTRSETVQNTMIGLLNSVSANRSQIQIISE